MATCTTICMGLVGEPCGKVLSTTTVPDDHPDAGKVSHGLCPDCYRKQMAQIEALLKDRVK